MPTTDQLIEDAASLIADIDPAMARVWRNRPFHRHTVVTAIHPEMERAFGEQAAMRVAVALRSVLDVQAREYAAREG